MALFRRSFSRKLPDHLLEISERIYVFDCCLSMDVMNDTEYKRYMDNVVGSLQRIHAGASFMVFNFKEAGDKTSQLSDILTRYDMTVVDYPFQYEGYPLLPLEMIHYFLRSGESWLSLEGQRNVILMHCDRGGWPVLAFMLAGLLLYRKQYSYGEHKTLEMVYNQAPKELLPSLMSPINPRPSQLRYLQYITSAAAAARNDHHNWPPPDAPLVLDCLVLRNLPLFDIGKGCRPLVRIYGQDPNFLANNNRGPSPRLLFSSFMSEEEPARYYTKGECLFVKVDIRHAVQADVFLECIHLHDDLVTEEMMFRVMFHTAFVQSNLIWSLGSQEIDASWTAKDKFPKDFKAEAFFSDYNTGGVPKDHNAINHLDHSSRQVLMMSDEDHESDSEFFEVEDFDSYVPLDRPRIVQGNNNNRTINNTNKAQLNNNNSKKLQVQEELPPPPASSFPCTSQQGNSADSFRAAETEDLAEKKPSLPQQQSDNPTTNYSGSTDNGHHHDHVQSADGHNNVAAAGNAAVANKVEQDDHVVLSKILEQNDHVSEVVISDVPNSPTSAHIHPRPHHSEGKKITSSSTKQQQTTSTSMKGQKQSKLVDAVAKVQMQRKVVAKWVPRNKLEPLPDTASTTKPAPKPPAYRWVPKAAASSSSTTSEDNYQNTTSEQA